MTEAHNEELRTLIHDIVGAHSAIGMGIQMLREGIKDGQLPEKIFELLQHKVSLLEIKFGDLKTTVNNNCFTSKNK